MLSKAIEVTGCLLVLMGIYFFAREVITGTKLETINPHDYLQDGILMVLYSMIRKY